MELYVSGDSDGFAPEEFEDVKLCLETLLSIRAGSQPLDRELGVNYDKVVGFPVPVAMNMLSLEIIEKVEKYEPRAEVDTVDFESDTDGLLVPHVHFIKRR